jgi:hypothetical protein
VTVTLLTLAVGVYGACYASFQVNHIDISTNHAGVLMGNVEITSYLSFEAILLLGKTNLICDFVPFPISGITNGFANLCGIAAPYVAGVIIRDGVS